MCHLRHKAWSCEFPSVDEAIRDQIIEKCRDPKLRRKFLEKSSEATLTVLQETARVHEAVNTQMQSMERPEQVNKLSPNDLQAKEKGTQGKKPGKERKCYRCGGTGHLAQDKSCPALDKTCNKRGKSGHFAACCKTKSTKKPSGRHRSEVHVHDSHGQQIMKVPLTLKRIINSQGFDAAVYNKRWCRCWIKKRWLLPRISFMELSLS